MMKTILILFLVLSSCSITTEEGFRREGAKRAKAFTEDLRAIHTKDELRASMPKVRRHFNEMAELVLEAREWRGKHPNSNIVSRKFIFESDALFAELARLYVLPGGRELIELAQSEAVLKLSSNDARCSAKTW